MAACSFSHRTVSTETRSSQRASTVDPSNRGSYRHQTSAGHRKCPQQSFPSSIFNVFRTVKMTFRCRAFFFFLFFFGRRGKGAIFIKSFYVKVKILWELHLPSKRNRQVENVGIYKNVGASKGEKKPQNFLDNSPRTQQEAAKIIYSSNALENDLEHYLSYLFIYSSTPVSFSIPLLYLFFTPCLFPYQQLAKISKKSRFF